MEFKDIIQKRRSVREFINEPVPDEKLRRVLEAARLAPSASNRQAWKFVVVKDSNKRKVLAQAANNQAFVGQAPIIIVAVALMPERIMTCGVPSYAVDLAIAMEHIVLAAVDEGLGTCWIGAFSQENVKRILGIPDKYKVVTVMPMGYPVGETAARPRKPVEEIVCYGKFAE
ncbi:MAG: nitroreductase [Dehalococcoidia bacterium]|nr:MAG: nitroreductase [Dehalococcoidia bacterium]